MPASIRPAAATELAELQRIQLDAGRAFRHVGMAQVADNRPLSLDVLAGYQRDGRALVAVDATDAPVGFVVIDVVDGAAHIEQVSVATAHARRGLGRALIDRVEAWAAGRRLPAVSLTTFRHVPFNAPYYARLGFVEIDPADLTPGLVAILVAEVECGLAAADRVAMRREVSVAAATG